MSNPPTLPPPRSPAPAPSPYPPMYDPSSSIAQPHPAYPPVQYPPGAHPQMHSGYPGHPGPMPVHGYPYPPPGYQQPINIVVQNTNTMTQNHGGGALVRVANRNKWAAAVLAFFFGWFGAHKFYLGQVGMGLVYLLFSWTFIPLLASMVETLMLVVASEREFDVRFNSRLAR